METNLRTTHVQIYMYTYTHLYDCVTLIVHTSMGMYVNINLAMRTHMTKSMGDMKTTMQMDLNTTLAVNTNVNPVATMCRKMTMHAHELEGEH